MDGRLGTGVWLLAGLLVATGCDDKGGDSGGGGADLVVASFISAALGSGHDFTVLVDNVGFGHADAFDVTIYLQESEPVAGLGGDATERVSGLGPGETTGVTISVDGSCTGCTAWVLVDSRDEIVEPYEDDNVSGPMTITD